MNSWPSWNAFRWYGREPVRKSGHKLWTDSYNEDVDYSDSNDDDPYDSESSIERNTSGGKGYVSRQTVVSIPVQQRSRSRERVRTPVVARRERSQSLSRERAVSAPLVQRETPPRRRRQLSVKRNLVNELASEVKQKDQDTVKRKKDKPDPVGFFGTTKEKGDKTSNGFRLPGISWKSSGKTWNREATASRGT
jgi:hypothetical protein